MSGVGTIASDFLWGHNGALTTMVSCRDHLVRVGVFGHVGRFVSVDPVTFKRGSRVICRSSRGLEVGEVLAHTDRVAARGDADGSLLRRMTSEDELLWARLQKNRGEAFSACQDLLTERSAEVALIEVETLFDARTLYFYFLGDVPPEIQSTVDALAARYESEVRIGDFAAAVEQGCGPNCGTEEADGCGSGSCSTCSLASSCHK